MSVEAGEYGPSVPDTTTETAWLAALRSRDEEAWRALHEREFALLYRFAVGMGADPGLAEDAANEAFMRLVTALQRAKFASPTALRSWLLVVCRNYVRDQIRKARRGPDRLADTDAEPAAADPDLTTRTALMAALAQLPQLQREVVVLRFIAGLPTREIAAISGRGIEAVESLQHRALRSLRRALGPEWEGT